MGETGLNRGMLKGWMCVGAAAAAALAVACVWDSDTLAAEAKGVPDVVNALVGRIDTNPPLYYEMRLDRAAKAIEAGESKPELYDDAAMAADRLGRSEEALEWMAKKEALLDTWKVEEGADPMTDPAYRFYANRGTLYAHKWLKDKMPADLSLLDKAIADLGKAIEINPDAHFGRESVQLAVIQMLAAHRDESRGKSPEKIWNELIAQEGREKVRQGVIGIMALGAGSQSRDMVNLLIATFEPEMGAMAQLGHFRAAELEGMGFPEVLPSSGLARDAVMAGSKLEDQIRKQFKELRDEAEKINQSRTDFMMPKLEAGEHPDTHPEFWSGYEERKVTMPEDPKPEPTSTEEIVTIGVLAGLLIAGASILIFRRNR